ncbi:MAG: 4-(cytidine 5'-diphospho)-2-C-methyl-D-erythritol kinase [Candidatus Bipolaricaulis anaerobius]|nr:4-(cytidine 5'-diphospho)-2-C-methyl-D-erythritol kinase [Candidatus Bipolaricaulis anaerobius]MDD5764227.1 4-(cytidine 5'-diphospho)-2-C-methyl-D-erythritol kinase [Candidatus Bipolaricaulis anaerobius]
MEGLRIHAHAKLNLVLRVVGRREDGYHLLQSLICAIDLADEIILIPQKRGIELSAPAELGPVERNLALRAAHALLPAGEPGVRIEIEKGIPAGAGLGGGSADAAAVLAGVNELLSLGRTWEELAAIGITLGADVPFFLGPSPAWLEGIGERVTPVAIPIPAAFLILVPPFRSPTPDVYRAFDELDLPLSPRTEPVPGPGFPNDLWPAAVHLFPELRRWRDLLARVAPGGVGMTGSGSALFAPFPSRSAAAAGRRRIRPDVEGELLVASPIRSGYRIRA